MDKKDIINKKLDKPLNDSFILTREQHGRKLDYIAGYIAIKQANRIFGYDGWEYLITDGPTLHKGEDKKGKPFWHVTCRVKTIVLGKEREDVGYSDVQFTKAGKPMIDVAYKGSVTDALKRALRSWGNQFGNSLYDKEEKLDNIQKSELSTEEELKLSEYMQKILDVKSLEELDELLEELVEIAKQDNWQQSHISYIKKAATRKKGILKGKGEGKDSGK